MKGRKKKGLDVVWTDRRTATSGRATILLSVEREREREQSRVNEIRWGARCEKTFEPKLPRGLEVKIHRGIRAELAVLRRREGGGSSIKSVFESPGFYVTASFIFHAACSDFQ